MQRRLDKRGTGKLVVLIGIGGINCPCCTLGPKPVTKKYWNRLCRAAAKRELLAELKDIQTDC